MNFYQECIGGKLDIKTLGESPMASEMPEAANKVMHASLIGDGFELMGSDMMRDVAVVGDNIAISINLDDEKKATTIFENLSNGGSVFMPMEKAYWGDLFGVVTDKYGIEWMVNCVIKK